MRLQLMAMMYVTSCVSIHAAFSQADTTQRSLTVIQQESIKADFLFTYYDQDGDNSAVTGGIGTQKLSDYHSAIDVYIPMDSISTLDVNLQVNYYTSASQDRIDQVMSSASSSDIRVGLALEYTRKLPHIQTEWRYRLSGSQETDYLSGSLGISWIKRSLSGDREFQLGFDAFLDKILLIIPSELRQPGRYFFSTDNRNTFTWTGSYSRMLTPRWQVSVMTNPTYQYGLLSTPFHRVYRTDSQESDLERLPGRRWRIPVGIRSSYFIAEFLTARVFYRYYWDNFGIAGNTASIEMPVRFGPVSLYPFYRFYQQSASDYFAPFMENLTDSPYATSDYDLSGFQSHKAGLGIRLSPIYGIFRMKRYRDNILVMESLNFRFANYRRSDGLQAIMFTTHFTFAFPGKGYR